MNKVLIVVDMQYDFIYGSLGSEAAQAIVPKVAKKVKNFNGDIICTKDTHFENYLSTFEGKNLPIEHCITGTPGHKLIPEVDKGLSVNKGSFGYDWCGLDKYDEIEICGLLTDICVVSNALILRSKYPEKRIVVDASCCAGSSMDNHKAALMVMSSCMIDII